MRKINLIRNLRCCGLVLLSLFLIAESLAQTSPPGGGKTGDLAYDRIFSYQVSSVALGSSANNAVDNNDATYWVSGSGGNQYIAIDLGSYRYVGRVRILWGPAYADTYDIQISGNGTTYVPVFGYYPVYGHGNWDNQINAWTQFIRLYIEAGINPSKYELATIEVYASTGVTPTPTPVLPSKLGACVLTSASWGQTQISEGDLVTLNIKSSGDCVGKEAQVVVTESNNAQEGSNDAPATYQPGNIRLLVNGASTTWQAEARPDCFSGTCYPPNEYFFSVTLNETGQTIRSSNPLLIVSQGASRVTYYIDPAGDNANSGILPTSPWRDFTNINARILQPGEQVLLKRGGEWNQQLTINGKGRFSDVITIGAYGSGPRPKISRLGDISERAMVLNNPSYINVSSLEVSNAGSGIVALYSLSSAADFGNQSVYFNDILGHHFTGIYAGAGNSSNNPSWHSYVSPDVDHSTGITAIVVGGQNNFGRVALRDMRILNSEFYKSGGAGIGSKNRGVGTGLFTEAFFENVYIHDNDWPDTSHASLALTYCQSCQIRDVYINNGTGGSPLGTSSIFFGGSYNTLVHNLVVNNTPLSWAADNTGIDFESGMYNTVIQNSWFENNAGGAIEFLNNGGANINTQIKKSAFVNNNSKNLSSGAPNIWVGDWPGASYDSGTVQDNWYINLTSPGTFFRNTATSRFTVDATNQSGTPATFPAGEELPNVNLTSPNDGQAFNYSVDIALRADALDLDGAIQKVEFYRSATSQNSSQLIGSDNASPYEVIWNNVNPDWEGQTWWIVAKAIDSQGNTAMSKTAVITMSNTSQDITPPIVSITSPEVNAVLQGMATISANVADNRGVIGVQFKLDGNDLGAEDTILPYSVFWSTVGNGSHIISAVARDAAGNQGVSADIIVTVSNPGSGITGDINNDTQVNVLDVQACVNHILGIQDLGNSADVNGDGSVNVLDVQAIVNIILGV